MTEHHDDYLWDGSGTPDAEVERLQSVLAPLAHRGTLPPLPKRTPAVAPRRAFMMRGLSTMAAVAASVALALAVWFGWGIWRGGWAVQTLTGTPTIDGRSIDKSGLLRRGGRLVTDAASRAQLVVGRIGRVEVEPDTRLVLVGAGGRDHRLTLERGTIHARISAPPRFFNVNTPSATVIDLGCAYTLQVDDSGAGFMRVTHGWVLFDYGGREAYIPQGAIGATRPGVGPGTPQFEDAPSGYTQALALLDFGNPPPDARREALRFVLDAARPRDALTLWHLLSRGSAAERTLVYERLAALAPPPHGVTREAALSGDRVALTAWWDSFGFEGTRWWQRLKKKF
jgi:hypothetical protein